MSKLMLHHEVMLLSLRDQEGTSIGAMYNYAVAGAILAELLLQNKIIATDDKKRRVSVADGSSLSNELLDEVISMVEKSKRQLGVSDWVMKIAMLKNLKHRVAQELCDMNVLKSVDDKVLWIFPRKVYPEVNPKVERETKNRMRKLMFGQTIKHDERTTLLVSLASHSGLLPYNFDKDRLKRNKDRIKKVAEGDMFAARATKDAITAVQAAMVAAVVIPTVVSN